jgi:proteasome lid subunit RPN8/RPN11
VSEVASSLPEGQQAALEALRSIAQASDGALTVDLGYEKLGGQVTVRVYLASASLLWSDQGIALADWEPIDIAIPEDFPYTSPIASTGRDDFPELPHQAHGSKFCVRVEDSNWDSTAAMPGFMRAVIEAYQHIALGTLQGHLQSWRPMDHYLSEGCAVIRADLTGAGRVSPAVSLPWAVGIQVSESRIDIVEWLHIDDDGATADLTEILAGQLERIRATRPGAFLVPAVIVTRPVALEYCRVWIQLLLRLEEHGIDVVRFLAHLGRAATVNQTSSEGQERAAVLFRAAADTGPTAPGQEARFAVTRLTRRDLRLLSDFWPAGGAAALPDQMPDEVPAVSAPWIRVYDARPQAIRSRAARRPTEKLAGARILLLGCGGLGAPIAEHCVRSGAARVHIVDSGVVSPGILARQPYEDADIGQPKAKVLAERLGRILPDNEVTWSDAEITRADIFGAASLEQYDLVIDATANRSVAAKIERCQRDDHAPWPALITVAINQQATHGVAAVTPRGAVGAGLDLLRQLGLRTCMSTPLADIYEAFFPPEGEELNFRPDTSCSDTTFIGSATDISALAAQLLDCALARLDAPFGAAGAGPPHRSLSITRLGRDDGLKAARVVLDLPPDRMIVDQREKVYEVRVDQAAMEAIRGHVRASANGRTPGSGHTGGLLLGQFDSTSRIAWVSQATGLPPGSTADSLKIKLDVEEVRDYLDDRSRRSDGMLTLVGFWHAHPGGPVAPSDQDRTTMRELVASQAWPSAPALLLIVGVPQDGSVGDPASPWEPEIHAETFVADPPDAASEGS